MIFNNKQDVFFLVIKISRMNYLGCNCYTYQTFQLLHLTLIKVNTSQYWQDEFSFLLNFISIKKCGSKILGSTLRGRKILSEKKFRPIFYLSLTSLRNWLCHPVDLFILCSTPKSHSVLVLQITYLLTHSITLLLWFRGLACLHMNVW